MFKKFMLAWITAALIANTSASTAWADSCEFWGPCEVTWTVNNYYSRDIYVNFYTNGLWFSEPETVRRRSRDVIGPLTCKWDSKICYRAQAVDKSKFWPARRDWWDGNCHVCRPGPATIILR